MALFHHVCTTVCFDVHQSLCVKTHSTVHMVDRTVSAALRITTQQMQVHTMCCFYIVCFLQRKTRHVVVRVHSLHLNITRCKPPVCMCMCAACRAAKAEQPDRVLEVDPLAHGKHQEVSNWVWLWVFTP